MMTELNTTRDAVENAEVHLLLEQAAEASSYDDALSLIAQAVTTQLLDALKASKTRKAQESVDSLKTSGLDRLLVEAWMRGRLTHQQVDRHLERLRRAIRTRQATPDQVKAGILAFDGAAQRLSLVSGKSGPFHYPVRSNRARDSLITFARALHR